MTARVMGPAAINAVNGSFAYLGTIAFSSAAKNNTDTATPFNDAAPFLKAKVLLVQPDQDVYILPVALATGSGSTVATTTGLKLTSGQPFILMMTRDIGYLSAIRSSADGNLKVWELT